MGTTKELCSQVDSITWTHTLKKSTINIAPLVTEQIEYIEIAFIHVELHEKGNCRKIAEVIQAIPYPVVLFMSCGVHLCMNVAKKRINQADISKLTTDEYLYTDWIDLSHPNDAQKAFLESLKLSHLSFENFYAFYADIADRIIALEAASISGAFCMEQTPQKKQTLDKIKSLQGEIASLRAAMKKETQFNAKVVLSIELKKANKKLNVLKGSL